MKQSRKIKAIISILLLFGICLIGFAQSTSETKEIGYIIFSPDSVVFENEFEAKGLLEQYTKSINEVSSKEKQIHINGYTAIFSNDIDPLKLSTNRANIILNELLLRGISSERFDIVKGNGGTSKWGNNNISEDRKPNRRVTISIDEFKESGTTGRDDNEEDKQIAKIDWKKIAIIAGIIVAVAVIVLLAIFVIAPALSGGAGAIPAGGGGGSGKAPRIKTPKISNIKSSAINTPQKQGGYFGELKQQIQKTGQDGTKAVHHMPSDSSLYVANKLDRGSAPAIIMDAADHVKTASNGNTLASRAYQTKQLDLLNAGKFDEALQMDIDDLKNLGLYSKYESGIKEMLEYIKALKTEGRL
jgi:hypothetical protein